MPAWRVASAGLVASAVLSVAVNPAVAAPAFNDPADLAAIRALETDLNTQTSMKGIIKYYAPDAVLADMMAPGYIKGSDKIYGWFEDQLKMVDSMTQDFRDFNIASNGQLACAAMKIHFNAKMKDGKSTSITVRQLDAFKKIDGQWKIIQQHISLPADPKSGMMVMDGYFPARGAVKWSSNPLPGPATTPEQAREEIRKWMDAGGVVKGIDQLMAYYGPGDDVIVFDMFYPGELRGLAEVRANYAPTMASYDAIKVKTPEISIDSDGSFGVQISAQDIELTMKDGSKKYLSLRQSDCLRRVNDKWYSFFEMISFPLDPRTGKGVMENPGAFK